MVISEYSMYSFVKNKVIENKTGLELKLQKSSGGGDFYRMKDDFGKIRSLSIVKIKFLCGLKMNLPNDAKKIPHTPGFYFIDKKSNVYSFSYRNPCGIVMKQSNSRGYKSVKINYKGRKRSVEVHQLMCVTFIMEDYVEKGLVCMHRDDVKANNLLSNLSVGTYSQNNKDAYSSGLNKGNGLKVVKQPPQPFSN